MNWSALKRDVAQLGRESWLLFIALSLTNASNYVFHVFVSRLLGPRQYGALGAVLAVLIVLSVPLSAIQTTVAKHVAALREGSPAEVRAVWLGAFRFLWRPALALTVVLAGLSPALASFLRLTTWTDALLLAFYVLPAVLVCILRGALQGSLRFKALAAVSGLPVVVRLLVGITAVYAGFGVGGALAATVLAEIVGLALSYILLRGGERTKIPSMRPIIKEIGPAALGLGAMWVLVELDLVLARHFLPGTEAGVYAASGLLARAVLFIPGAVSLIALPHFAKARGRGAEAFRWLSSSIAVVFALGIAATLFLIVARGPVMSATFGDEYQTGAFVLPLLAFGMVGWGVTNLLVFYHIAAGTRAFHLLWFVSLVETVALFLSHSSGIAIAEVVAVAAWVSAAAGFITARSLALSPAPLMRLPVDLEVRQYSSRTLPGRPELSIVVPSFNGGVTLREHVDRIVHALDVMERTYEIIVVSDGSTDGSLARLASDIRPVRLIHYPTRQGKGVALRVGMTQAEGRYVAFIDADGDLDPADLHSFLQVMDLFDPDLVIGSKRHPLSMVHYPMTRRAMSWCYQLLIRVLFRLNVRDTQTGLKLIRRDVLDEVLPRMLEKRFAFDLEFLVVARRLGYRRFFEAPIRLDYQFRSTISPNSILQILTDTAGIFYRRFVLRYYDEKPVALGPSRYIEPDGESPPVAAVETAAVEQGVRG